LNLPRTSIYPFLKAAADKTIGFDDGEVNKQSVTKIESLFLEIDVITFKQFPLVRTSFYVLYLVAVGNHEIVRDIL
jgi:hypothetical protein